MADRVRVAFISLYPSGPHRHSGRSGVASYTKNLADAVDASGAAVTVVAPTEDGEPSLTTDGAITVRRSFRRGTRAFVDAARDVARTSASIVHVQFETFLLGGPLALAGLVPALAYLKGTGRRLVVTLHHVVDPSTVDRGFVERHGVRVPAAVARVGIAGVQSALRRLADAVIVHEPSFTTTIGAATVVPHGIESLPRPPRAAARAELGLGTRPVVLCFGFVAPYKGLEVTIDAARLAGGAFDLVIAGGEHPRLAGKDAYIERLRAQSARSKGAVHFTGFVPEPAVATWFAAADVALFPYPAPFSSSGALALALAHRTPVLMSAPLAACMNAPAALATGGDPVSLANDLVRLFEDSQRRTDVEHGSRALAADRSWPEIGRRHVELYEGVLDADRAGRRSVRTR